MPRSLIGKAACEISKPNLIRDSSMSSFGRWLIESIDALPRMQANLRRWRRRHRHRGELHRQLHAAQTGRGEILWHAPDDLRRAPPARALCRGS